MSKINSIFDLLEAEQEIATVSEVASIVKEQATLEQSGKLIPVVVHGPNSTFIDAYYSVGENAYVPKFN